MTYDKQLALKRTNRSLSIAVVALSVLCVVSFGFGRLYGYDEAQKHVTSELESLHTARLYEDGSWVIIKKDGTGKTGCLLTGLCQED